MQVGFFDARQNKLIHVEQAEFTWEQKTPVAMMLSTQYQLSHHRIPSPIWVCWDADDISIWNLSGDFVIPDFLLSSIEADARNYGFKFDQPTPFTERRI